MLLIFQLPVLLVKLQPPEKVEVVVIQASQVDMLELGVLGGVLEGIKVVVEVLAEQAT